MSQNTERFSWKKNDVKVSQCAMCKNFTNFGACIAFPGGIPDTILTNEHDHTTPYPGDNGIQFEPIEKDTA